MSFEKALGANLHYRWHLSPPSSGSKLLRLSLFLSKCRAPGCRHWVRRRLHEDYSREGFEVPSPPVSEFRALPPPWPVRGSLPGGEEAFPLLYRGSGSLRKYSYWKVTQGQHRCQFTPARVHPHFPGPQPLLPHPPDFFFPFRLARITKARTVRPTMPRAVQLCQSFMGSGEVEETGDLVDEERGSRREEGHEDKLSDRPFP